MANYFYVKSGGALTGSTPYSAAQTGSFAGLTTSNYYDSVYAAVTNSGTTPTGGDYVLVSDAHTGKVLAGATYSIRSGGYTTVLSIIGVSDTAVDSYSPGADEETTASGADIQYYENVYVAGVSLVADDFSNFLWNGATLHCVDTTCGNAGHNGDQSIRVVQDGCLLILTNTDIYNGVSNADPIALSSSGRIVWNGGTLTGVVPDNFFETLGGLGGASMEFNGVDLSIYDNTLMPSMTAGIADIVSIKLRNCKLHADMTLHGTLTLSQQRFEMYNCDNGTDDKFYRFYIADGAGSAKNNDSVYVTATETWYEGSDKSSIQVDTNAICSYAIPFIFELPAQYVNLAEGTTDVLTIDIVTAETLVKHDLAAFLVYPDGTTAVTPVWVSSGPSVGSGNYGIDPLDTSTAMPTSALGAGDWTGEPGTPNFYELVLDTSGTPGQATAVSVRIEVYKASIGPIYIHPLITVSAT